MAHPLKPHPPMPPAEPPSAPGDGSRGAGVPPGTDDDPARARAQEACEREQLERMQRERRQAPTH